MPVADMRQTLVPVGTALLDGKLRRASLQHSAVGGERVASESGPTVKDGSNQPWQPYVTTTSCRKCNFAKTASHWQSALMVS